MASQRLYPSFSLFFCGSLGTERRESSLDYGCHQFYQAEYFSYRYWEKKMSDWVIFLVGAVVTGIWGSVVGSLLYVAITDKKSGD